MANKKELMIFFSSLILLLLLISQEVLGQVSEKEVQIVVGIDKVEKLTFRPSTKVEVGNSQILSYTLIPDDHIREITFKGLAPGKTSVIVRATNGEIRARYSINVVSNDLSRTVVKLRELFHDIEGINVDIRGGVIVVEGKLIVPSDIGKARNILERDEFKDVMVFLELSPQTQHIVAKRMQEEIQKNGIKDVTVRVVNKQYWLEGFVSKKGDSELALRLANGLLPDKVAAIGENRVRDDIVNFITENIKRPPEPLPKLVRIIAQFVELTKDYKKTFGFSWTPALAGDGGSIQIGKTTDGTITSRSSGTLSGTISNLFPKLSSARSAGNARILQQGMVVVKERIQAVINKTTNVPFSVGTGDFTQPQNSESGFRLSVTPEIKTNQNIEMKTNLTVNFVTGGTPPQTVNNGVNTTLVVRSTESAVIGGISFNEATTQYDKDPPFGGDQFDGATPLFSFIRSKDYTTAKSQFVVFITPEIIDSASRGTELVKRKFRRRR